MLPPNTLWCVALQVGNIQLGIPVRMIRKNAVKGSELGYMYIFDGLYNVVRPSPGHEFYKTMAVLAVDLSIR